MTDYTELVKALRYCAESGDFNCNKDCPMYPNYPRCLTKMDMDAAAAIEALEARLGEAENSVERWKDMYLTKHEPKRVEFEKSLHEMFDSIWDCDINHPIFQDTVGELMEAVLQAYDTVNGKKMEVQE